MQETFNRIVKGVIPYMPRSVIKVFANRYVAGTTVDEAMEKVRDINLSGLSATIDILGEHTKDSDDARSIAIEYAEMYNIISERKLDCNISIKLSHIGLDIDGDTCGRNLDIIIENAKACSNFLRIDMENSSITDSIIDLCMGARARYENIGTVFQSYLHRTMSDIQKLESGSNFRICKGIYKEDESVAYQLDEEINKNFLDAVEYAFLNGIYVGIATHDPKILESVYTIIDRYQARPEMFEFQVLYGVPMGGWIERHRSKGYKVRVYVPFGRSWYEYSMRRLKENPNIAGYIIKNLFKR